MDGGLRALRPDSAQQFWFEREVAKGWTAAARLGNLGGQTAVVELRIFPTPRPGVRREPGQPDTAAPIPPGGIRSALVRAAARRHKAHYSSAAKAFVRAWPPFVRVDMSDALGALGRSIDRRQMRAGRWSERQRVLVAATVLAAWQRDEVGAVSRMAERLGCKAGRVTKAIAWARNAGYVTQTRPGMKGGQLTPAGVELIRVGDARAARASA